MFPRDLMYRRKFLLLLSTVVALAAAPAFADVEDQVTRQLRKQGFKQIEVTSTLLGRTRILAKRRDGTREIILNPRTGEILRDMWAASGSGTHDLQIVGDGDEASNVDGAGEDDGGSDNSGEDGGGEDGGEDSGEDGGEDNSGEDGGEDGEQDNSGSSENSGNDGQESED